MRIIPFTTEHLPAAGALLAQRHRIQREHQPLLPARFESAQTAQALIESLWATKGARGYALVADEALHGFLISRPLTAPIWGRTAQIPFAGHALAPNVDLEWYRDLYAALAADLTADGFFSHQAIVSTHDPRIAEAWFNLSFGKEQVHAFRPPADPAAHPLPAGVTVRRAGPEDLEGILSVADLIAKHQAVSPVFGPLLPEQPADWREGWAEMLADGEIAVWIALHGEQIIAHQAWAYGPATPHDLLTPERSAYLEVAAVRPEWRGNGLAKAMTAIGLSEMASAGRPVAVTDWRAANLLSSRTWPKVGFTPVAFRLTRRIDERVAWAR